MRHGKQKTCAKLGCKRMATQAFDVGSWFRDRRRQDRDGTLIHYEVCDKHADYFTGCFDVDASRAVRKDLAPWPGMDK